MSFDPSRLDRTLHEPVRLAVASLLASRAEASFTELREMLDVTDGNLSVHLKALQEAGYGSVEKAFVERKPRTTVRLSRKGREALEKYLDALEAIVKAARSPRGSARPQDADAQARAPRDSRKR